MGLAILIAASALVLGAMFLVTVLLLIPRALQEYSLWKDTCKEKHLAMLIPSLTLIFFFLSGIFVILIQWTRANSVLQGGVSVLLFFKSYTC